MEMTPEMQNELIEKIQTELGKLITTNMMLMIQMEKITIENRMLHERSEALILSRKEQDRVIAELQEQIAPGRLANKKAPK
jgi:hypothetical protein